MECSVRQIDPCRCRIGIKIPVVESEVVYDGCWDTMQRKVRSKGIPGFRKNKIPDNVLEARFGPQVAQQAFQKVVNDALDTALEQAKIRHHTQFAFQFQSSRRFWRGSPIAFDVTWYNRGLHPALIKLPGERGEWPAWRRQDDTAGEIATMLMKELQADKGGSRDISVSAG